MKISLNWLKNFIELNNSPEEISNLLTEVGLEVESIEKLGNEKSKLNDLVIGEIKKIKSHSNANKLQVTEVDVGREKLKIVCGAKNIKENQKVVVAKPGTFIYPLGDQKVKISKTKIRGEDSEGMLCSEKEIGIGNDEKGIIILKDNKIKNGAKAYKYFDQNEDFIFDISLTPNRADAASHLGVARDLKSVLNISSINLPKDNLSESNSKKLKLEVKVQDSSACPRYSGILISEVEIKDSPKWLQNNLQSIGLKPINNIVDITNYILHSFGQPMHAFDYDKIKSKKIKVQFLKEGTKFSTLDGVKRELKNEDLMICDDKTPLCIAGVLGGESSEVKNKTKNIFLESAYFNPKLVRKSSQNHQISTDASFRFERGTDPNITVYSLKIAAKMIKELSGGKIASKIIDIYPKKIKNTVLQLDINRVNKLIGVSIPKKEIIKILNSLEINSKNINDSLIELSIPPYRTDVKREADIVEEILRIYGYNNINLSKHLGSEFLSKPSKTKIEEDFVKNIINLLVSNGYYEITTNSLTSIRFVENEKLWNKNDSIEMINKLSEEHGVLKTHLLFTSLEVIKYNLNRKQKNLKLFELDKTYKKEKSSYRENKKLGIYLVGNNYEDHFNKQNKDSSINDIKDIVHKLLQKCKINNYNQKEFKDSFFKSGILIKKDKNEIAKIGQLSEEIKKQFEISENIFYAEIDWKNLYDNSKEQLLYKPVSKFPEVQRDLSLILDKSVKFIDIENIVEKNKLNLIKKIHLYDIYEGKNINNKKAYAIRFILQDDNKTLDEKSINHTMETLIGSFEKELEAEIRK